MEGYQIQNILEMLIAASATVGTVWIIARAWSQRRQLKGADPKLIEAVDRMRESVDGMRDELADVSERLEFTERMLGRLGNPEEGRLPRS